MKRLLSIPLLLFSFASSYAQKKIPVYKSNTANISILDGKDFKANSWTISPQVKPDVYTTSNRKVAFYTDLDTIIYNLKPNNNYDFYIILKGKDSALTRITCIPSYLEKLKSGSQYNLQDNRFVPAFTYQSKEDEHLKRIRKDLNLDSVAGTGNEVSQMINLLHFVHDVIRHNGNSNNPTLQNAIDIIKVCQEQQRGVNCRMMATVLNECYLAMGFKSRFVTCMPRELKFDDCHVINMVYSTELKKWLWMDPTFNAYVMNEKGDLLGIEEVRERLIKEQPLILNPDANWNRKSSQTKEGYLKTYMAKNLYRLECPVASTYNTETTVEGKAMTYIQLIPLNAVNQSPQKSEQRNEETKMTWTNYLTNNPKLFWASPEG